MSKACVKQYYVFATLYRKRGTTFKHTFYNSHNILSLTEGLADVKLHCSQDEIHTNQILNLSKFLLHEYYR